MAGRGLIGGQAAGDPGKQLFMEECAVVEIDPPTREFIAAARTALQAATLLDDLEPAKTRLYNALDAAFLLLDTREPFGADFYASVPAALQRLREGIAQAGPPLDAEIIAAGHAHIDVAWLWTLGQTRRKAGRTFHTVLRLMEQFPDYHFTQSQPQLYDYVRQDYPDLFAAIKEQVAAGRWEPIGGMWVEADCNITGPESLARQFLLGRAFFRQHFGPDAESPRALAARRVRLRLEPAAVDQAGRAGLFLHDQDRLEPGQQAARRLVLVAGAGRDEGADPLQHHPGGCLARPAQPAHGGDL